MRGRVGTDIGIKLLPVMWVFLCITRDGIVASHDYYNTKLTTLSVLDQFESGNVESKFISPTI